MAYRTLAKGHGSGCNSCNTCNGCHQPSCTCGCVDSFCGCGDMFRSRTVRVYENDCDTGPAQPTDPCTPACWEEAHTVTFSPLWDGMTNGEVVDGALVGREPLIWESEVIRLSNREDWKVSFDTDSSTTLVQFRYANTPDNVGNQAYTDVNDTAAVYQYVQFRLVSGE